MIQRSMLGAWVLMALVVPRLAAQGPDGVDPRFRELRLPEPNAMRAATGRPGPEYWQQRVDYDIKAELSTGGTIEGSQTVTYANESPDSLGYLWMQLDQNLFAQGSLGRQAFPQQDGLDDDFDGGFTLGPVKANGETLESRVFDTLMRIDLNEPLLPGEVVKFSIEWSFPVPWNGVDRMGRDGSLFLIAQWYPRMVVYDDIEGWNTLPYLGQGEFYLEYGDFTVELTVPASYLVGATGTLENPEEVLTEEQIARLAEAAKGSDIVPVVAAEELAEPALIRPAVEGTLTWRFRAENVRDFAWVAGPNLVWDSTSVDDILVHALYRPAASAWKEAARMSRHSIAYYRELFGEYPYPQATIVEGPVFGMEYPMIVFVADVEDREELFDIIDHEWAHMWVPMIVGTDERRHVWMDEGFATFVGLGSKKKYFPESRPVLENVAQYATAIRAYPEQPIGTRPDRFDPNGPALGVAGYVKPAVMLAALRAIGGAEPFDRALTSFIWTWAFRHPQPADFYRFMENELGMELGWFWYAWIHTTATNDMAILGQDQKQFGDVWVVRVTVDQRGDLVMPARVEAWTEEGERGSVTIPVDAFYGSDRATATLMLPGKAVRIAVNGGPEWGDVVPRNNTWEK